MKKALFVLLTLGAFVFITPGCKKDNNDEPKNEFTYDGSKYSLSKGFIKDFGSNGNGTFDWDVYLTTDGVTVSGGLLTGVGNLIYLDLNGMSSTGIESGTYTWSATRENFTIVGATMGIDFNFVSLQGTYESGTSGTATVTQDGTETKIEFSLTFTNGNTVSGQWKGTLEMI
jgi:hypothetical protein